ncbi:Uncharacterized protein dnl_12030 [Desulfonema limicola]|uniref:Uncharacterized protein n=1 Tax=Desulfonema limicola TaxID=45656 RepID=A0A975GF65_9BACT|nr:hypothetical protein [Desulfonema limicola]QTA78956.1 Uncharacterized protein dnl_12030 [Desulfonema limicola]
MKQFFKTAVLINAMILIIAFSANAQTHIYIDQTNGSNTKETAGTEADPFKSITYAFLVMTSN